MRPLLIAVVLCALAAAPAHAAGRLDRSFAGGAGWRTLTVGAGSSNADAMLVTRRGKLLLGGQAVKPGSFVPALGFARLHPSGRFDRRFGRRGRTVADPPGYTTVIAAMAELPDGRVLAAFGYEALGSGEQAFGVLRLRADGRVDRSYGTRGYARLPVPGGHAWLRGVAVLPDGGAVLVGGAALPPPDGRRTLIGRLDPAGRPAGEVAALSLGGATGTGAAALPGGRVIVAATRDPSAGAGPMLTTLFEVDAAGQPLPSPRREVPAEVVDLRRDPAGGVGVLLRNGRRFGVRRYRADLGPRSAPARLPMAGWASALAMARRGVAWVAVGDQVARVRADGRPDRRWGVRGRTRPLRTSLLVYAATVAAMPRGRVAAGGRAAEEGDMREDYGQSYLWAGVWR